ncbi:MAG: hypothetical protein ACI4PG_05780 [Candidatus Ventricola sp.]
MGIVSERRHRQRMQRIRRRLLVAAIVALLAGAAMTPVLRQRIAETVRQGMQAAQAFAPGRSAQAELTLPEREVAALQMGVFDSGERAASEAQRLQAEGVRCVIWQRDKMRIVSDVALSRDGLNAGEGGYVIRETLPRVSMRLTADAGALEAVQALLMLPDALLTALLDESQTLETLLADTRATAERALGTHPESALYTQLAQSLINWCALIEQTRQDAQDEAARRYAAVTMCTLCRELRMAIANQAPSAASTASAQRMPSTAADVMPPA